jgi:hypothetical protein
VNSFSDICGPSVFTSIKTCGSAAGGKPVLLEPDSKLLFASAHDIGALPVKPLLAPYPPEAPRLGPLAAAPPRPPPAPLGLPEWLLNEIAPGEADLWDFGNHFGLASPQQFNSLATGRGNGTGYGGTAGESMRHMQATEVRRLHVHDIQPCSLLWCHH